MSEPITGTTEIDFLRSTTTITVDREADGDKTTRVEHIARFAVNPGALPDQVQDYGRRRTFRPAWLGVRWSNGKLSGVTLSGKRLLKSGRFSEHMTDRNHWSTSQLKDRSVLPAAVRDAIAAYETAVAGQDQGATSL